MIRELDGYQGPTVVAVSGGIDSCVLLHHLHMAALEVDADLIVVHVDHQLRPESGDDAEFVRSLGRLYGRPVFVRPIQVRKCNSVQAQARTQRYAAMAQVAHSHGTRRIATGHHAQDQDENQALKTELGRFGDLETLRELTLWNIEIWRPLLSMGREAIEAYAHRHDLAWREDPSNASTTYSRNAVRLTGFDYEKLPVESNESPNIRRLTAHRWVMDGHDVGALRRACNTITGVRITRRAIEACSAGRSVRTFTQGAVIARHPDGFEIIRSTCQGDRALPVSARSMEGSIDFGKVEF